MKHKYEVTITFESSKPVRRVKKSDQGLIQYENGLTYFTEGDINNTFVYGTGSIKLRKVRGGK